jgi:hypothetical protein
MLEKGNIYSGFYSVLNISIISHDSGSNMKGKPYKLIYFKCKIIVWFHLDFVGLISALFNDSNFRLEKSLFAYNFDAMIEPNIYANGIMITIFTNLRKIHFWRISLKD